MDSSTITPQAHYKALGTIKGQNVIIKQLHEQINHSIGWIEHMILKLPDGDPYEKDLHELLLQTMFWHKRTKLVARYKVWSEDAKKTYTVDVDKQICANGDWVVTKVRDNSKIRITLSASALADLRRQMDGKKDVIIYG